MWILSGFSSAIAKGKRSACNGLGISPLHKQLSRMKQLSGKCVLELVPCCFLYLLPLIVAWWWKSMRIWPFGIGYIGLLADPWLYMGSTVGFLGILLVHKVGLCFSLCYAKKIPSVSMQLCELTEDICCWYPFDNRCMRCTVQTVLLQWLWLIPTKFTALWNDLAVLQERVRIVFQRTEALGWWSCSFSCLDCLSLLRQLVREMVSIHLIFCWFVFNFLGRNAL